MEPESNILKDKLELKKEHMKCLQENHVSNENSYLKIDRKAFFCEMQEKKLWEQILLLPNSPSTLNFMIDTINKMHGNLNRFYQLFNTSSGLQSTNAEIINYCTSKEKNYRSNAAHLSAKLLASEGNLTRNIDLANNHQINFFMHYTTNSKLLLYITSIMSPFKLKYYGVHKLGGDKTLISYVQAVKEQVKIIDVVNSHGEPQTETQLSNYFIFSKDILDAYDWYTNYGWKWGNENEPTTHHELDFIRWISDYQNINRNDDADAKTSDKIDKSWPIINEFMFKNPISLKYCLKIIISDSDMLNNKLFQLFKRLCPNTFVNYSTFEANRSTYNFTGINYELVNLNYDIIYLFLEENNEIDIGQISDATLDEFRINNGIEKIYVFDPPKKFVILATIIRNLYPTLTQLLNLLFDQIANLIKSNTDIIVYKYLIVEQYGEYQDVFSDFLDRYGYSGQVKFPFAGFFDGNKMTAYLIGNIIPIELYRGKEISSDKISQVINNINDTTVKISADIIKDISQQIGGQNFYKKYLKYRKKYLDLKYNSG